MPSSAPRRLASPALPLAFLFGALLTFSACSTTRVSTPAPEPEDAGAIVASIDLTDISDDRLLVEVDPGALEEGEVLFRLPRVIPGTYKVYDFGQYTEEFQAYGYDGEALPAEQLDASTWRIADGARLDRVAYYVNDTYELERSNPASFFDSTIPFSPSGTDIDPDIFLLNLHGFVGYFEGMTEQAYEIRVTAPLGMEKAASLPRVASNADAATVTDIYQAERYFEVTDNPMMYGDLDVASFAVDDIDITLGLYSPNGTHKASDLSGVLQRMMAAQRAYLGDLETTDHYNVYLYLFENADDQPKGVGALEHHTSTVAVLPEAWSADGLAGVMVDVVSHEFFHIVSPLNVHSEDIQYFDYHTPTFSKHLWMYEGLTEYFASHFQVYEGLESRDAFYQKMVGKMNYAASLDDTMSFTEMSENVIDEPYASNYLDVYAKGALIGMCLDLIMREQSDGERSMLSLMKELSGKYGKDRPFEDDGLIDEITAMTYPEVGSFLETHVVGTTPIDYGTCLAKAGLEVAEQRTPTALFLLDEQTPFITVDQERNVIFVRDIELNSTLQDMGVEPGDVIKSVNGQEYTTNDFIPLLQASMQWGPDTELDMVVTRDGEEVELTGTMGAPSLMGIVIAETPDPTAEQLALREAWLGS